MRIALAAALCAALSACATAPACPPAPAPPTPKTANVLVPVKCAPAIGAAPPLPDSDAALAAMDLKADVLGEAKALRAGRLLRDAYIAELQAALGACEG